MNETKWIFKGKKYNTRREIKDKFNISTSVFDAKLRDGEIIKLIKQVTADEKLNKNTE